MQKPVFNRFLIIYIFRETLVYTYNSILIGSCNVLYFFAADEKIRTVFWNLILTFKNKTPTKYLLINPCYTITVQALWFMNDIKNVHQNIINSKIQWWIVN